MTSKVSVAKQQAKFTALEASACVYAVAVPYSLASLDEWVEKNYVVKADARGMVKPIPVMDSKPTHDIDEVRRWCGAMRRRCFHA